MNFHSRATRCTAPLPETLIARAEGLIPLLRGQATEADRNARLARETVQELREAGFFRILQPAHFGGYGMRPSTLWEVTCRLGRGCGSSAFLMSLLGVHCWIVGMFEPAAQADVFRDGCDAIVPNLSIGARRSIEGTRVDGGYRIGGVWDFASGIDFADWVIAAIRVPDVRGEPEERIALVKADAFAIEADSWNMLGARATGSKRVSLSDSFVPAYRTVAWADVQAGAYPGAAVNDGPLYERTCGGSLFVLSSAAPVVAVAGAVVEHFVAQATKRKPQQWVAITLGRSASQIHMAHALLIHDADEVYDAGVNDEDLSVEVQARHRADAAIISRTALDAADQLLSALGTSALGSGLPAERALRDIHTMASHFRVQPEPACELYGKVLLGLEE
jgi:3-hydroxy-9,10-secoandrosta-1,3,5(10)-triene-9,17-dione monooxygenase